MYIIPALCDPKGFSFISDLILRYLENLSKVFIRESILFRLNKSLIRRYCSLVQKKSFLLFYKLLHLLDKVSLNLGNLKDFIYRGTLSKCLIHLEMSLAGRSN